jgi:hypothetical protein
MDLYSQSEIQYPINHPIHNDDETKTNENGRIKQGRNPASVEMRLSVHEYVFQSESHALVWVAIQKIWSVKAFFRDFNAQFSGFNGRIRDPGFPWTES